MKIKMNFECDHTIPNNSMVTLYRSNGEIYGFKCVFCELMIINKEKEEENNDI